jgi:hypothetical protein
VGPRSYSNEQAAAIIAACIDCGLSMSMARQAAANGELDGLEPFALSPSAIQRLVSRERIKRLETEPFDARAARLAKRALAVAEREMTRIERLSKLTAKDRAALDKLGRLAANLRSKPWRNKSADDVIAEEPKGESFLARLGREAAENGSAIENPAPSPAPKPPKPSWALPPTPSQGPSPEERVQKTLDALEPLRAEAAARHAVPAPTPAEQARRAHQ